MGFLSSLFGGGGSKPATTTNIVVVLSIDLDTVVKTLDSGYCLGLILIVRLLLSLNSKSGIILFININWLPSSISKSADSMNDVSVAPSPVKTPDGSLSNKKLPVVVAPVVIVLPNISLSLKVVKKLSP